MKNNNMEKKLLLKIRLLLVFFIVCLVGAGVTAFPLEWEMRLLCDWMDISLTEPLEAYTGLSLWIATVTHGIIETNINYPFLLYGTDWLAFAHIGIAVAFVGPLLDPIRNKWVIQWAMIMCVGILPLAFICGPIREIPFYWTLIDCSFGIFGIVPLIICYRYIRQLEEIA